MSGKHQEVIQDGGLKEARYEKNKNKIVSGNRPPGVANRDKKV